MTLWIHNDTETRLAEDADAGFEVGIVNLKQNEAEIRDAFLDGHQRGYSRGLTDGHPLSHSSIESAKRDREDDLNDFLGGVQ